MATHRIPTLMDEQPHKISLSGSVPQPGLDCFVQPVQGCLSLSEMHLNACFLITLLRILFCQFPLSQVIAVRASFVQRPAKAVVRLLGSYGITPMSQTFLFSILD